MPMLMASCTSLLSNEVIHTTYYSLDRVYSKALTKPALNNNDNLPILIVNTPIAAPGFDTQRMMYTRAPYQLEYFAKNEWIDTPAKMLRPLMISTIEKTSAFNTVLAKQSVTASDIRLESELIKLVQNFNTTPSHVEFILRVSMIDSATNKVIALQEFNERVDAKSDNPMGGVIAANAAINLALNKLGNFSSQVVSFWLSQSKLKKNNAE